MKKIVINLLALFAICVGTAAQQVAMADVEALPGENVSLTIQLDTDGGSYTGVEFDILFPQAGFATTGNAVTTQAWDGSFTIGDVGVFFDYTARCGVLSYSDTSFPGDGLQQLGTVEFTVGNDIAIDSYTITLTNITLIGDERVPVPDAICTLNVVSVHQVTLDETSPSIPEAVTNANVRVKRTIKGDEWSTICLPFAMSETQVKEAFGDDVELADFTSWASEEDEEGNIVGISVGFENVSEVEANHPYIIKVASTVEEFTADGVDIEPEDEPTVQVGKKKAERGYFIGTYVAGTEVPENDLFLSGNQFWYSTGKTKMKAYRAYFEFADVLTVVEEAAAKVRFNIGGAPTAIEGIAAGKYGQDGAVYDLSGRRLSVSSASSVLPKGMYIVNGKKIIIK